VTHSYDLDYNHYAGNFSTLHIWMNLMGVNSEYKSIRITGANLKHQ